MAVLLPEPEEAAALGEEDWPGAQVAAVGRLVTP